MNGAVTDARMKKLSFSEQCDRFAYKYKTKTTRINQEKMGTYKRI